jgi:hypothetical protein
MREGAGSGVPLVTGLFATSTGDRFAEKKARAVSAFHQPA